MAEKLTLDILLNPVIDAAKLNTILRAIKAALGEFGDEIKLIDEADLKKQGLIIEEEFEDVARRVGDDFEDEFKKSGKKSGDNFADSFKSRLKNIGDIAVGNLLARGMEGLTQVVGEGVNQFVELDKQVRNVGTLGVQNLEDVTAAMTDLSKLRPDDAGMLTSGLYDAISAGTVKVKDGMLDVAGASEFMDSASKLAAGGMTSTADAVNGLTSILNAYKLEASDTADISDQMFTVVKQGKITIPELNASLKDVVPIAAAMGIQFNNVGAALATMTKQGVPAAQASTQLKSAMAELQKPGAALAPVMKAAGVSLESIREKGLQSELAKLGDTMDEMGVSATQTFSSIEAGAAVTLLTGENAKLAAEDLDALGNSLGAADEAYKSAAQSLENQIKILKNNVQSAFNNLLSGLQPTITSLLSFLTESILPVIESVFNSIQPLLQSVLTSLVPVVDGLLKALEPLLSVIIDILVPIIDTLFEALQPIIDVLPELGDIFGEILKAVQPLITQFVKLGSEIFARYAKELLPPIMELFKSMVPLIESLAEIGVSLLDAFEPIAELFQGAFIIGLKAAIAVINATVDSIKWLVDAGESVINFFSASTDGIEAMIAEQEKLNGALEETTEKSKTMGETVKDAYEKMADTPEIKAAIENIGGAFDTVLDKATATFEGIKTGINDAISTLSKEAAFYEANKKAVDAVNKSYADGNITLEKAQKAIQKLRDAYSGLNEEKSKPAKTSGTGTGAAEKEISDWERAIDKANEYITSTEQLGEKRATERADALASSLLLEFTLETEQLDKTSKLYIDKWAELQDTLYGLTEARIYKSNDLAKEVAEDTDPDVAKFFEKNKAAQDAYDKRSEESQQKAVGGWEGHVQAVKDSAESIQYVYETLSGSLNESMRAIGAGQEDAGRAVISSMFDLLESMVPIWSAQILGASLAQPLSIMTYGAEGFANWALWTGIIEAAVALARGALSYADGGIVDSPLLAVVGDAKKSGNSSNAELILNQSLFGDMVDGIIARYSEAMNQYFETPVSYGPEGDISDINQMLLSLNDAIEDLKPHFDNFTIDNLLDVTSAFDEQKYLDQLYESNQIAIEDYADKLSVVQNRIGSSVGTSAVSNAGLELLSSSALEQSAVLNDAGLRRAIVDSASFIVVRLERKLEETSDKIVSSLENFDGRLHVLESETAQSVNRYNTRNTKTFKTRRQI